MGVCQGIVKAVSAREKTLVWLHLCVCVKLQEGDAHVCVWKSQCTSVHLPGFCGAKAGRQGRSDISEMLCPPSLEDAVLFLVLCIFFFSSLFLFCFIFMFLILGTSFFFYYPEYSQNTSNFRFSQKQ